MAGLEHDASRRAATRDRDGEVRERVRDDEKVARLRGVGASPRIPQGVEAAAPIGGRARIRGR